MRKSIVKEKLKRGTPVLCVATAIHHPCMPGLAGLMGFDCVWLDFQHHVTDPQRATSLIQACVASDIDAMARPGIREFEDMRRFLESGASGILYPQGETIEEFREVVSRAKFSPLGRRGFDGGSADAGYTLFLDNPRAYVERCNEETFVIVQIESQKAAELAGEIAEIDGIDGLFVGCADLSLDLGVHPGDKTPELDQCIDRVAKAAEASGKAWGLPVATAENAKRMMDRGATFLAHECDLFIVRDGWAGLQEDFGKLGFEFRPHARV